MRSAFTLIELLVTVAFIGLLASLLLPVLARAKEKGRRAKCMSNLREIGVGLKMYVDDSARYPYFLIEPTTSQPPVSIDIPLQPYTRNYWTNELWKCPSYTGLTRYKKHSNSQTIFLNDSWNGSYAYNPSGTGDYFENLLGLSGYKNGTSDFPGREESQIRSPSQMLAFGDSQFGGPELNFLPEPFPVLTIPDGTFAGWFILKTSHADLSNFLFTDAHVEFKKVYELVATNEVARRKWNYDFEPH